MESSSFKKLAQRYSESFASLLFLSSKDTKKVCSLSIIIECLFTSTKTQRNCSNINLNGDMNCMSFASSKEAALFCKCSSSARITAWDTEYPEAQCTVANGKCCKHVFLFYKSRATFKTAIKYIS
jgi:hypothetical protein